MKQAPVLYIAAEGGAATYHRLAALAKKHKRDDVPFYIITASPDLATNGKDATALVKLVKDFEANKGLRFKLIVVDTVAMALGGANENAPEGMGALISNATRLRNETGAHVALVHHEGKSKDNGPRGHSSLFGFVDTALNIIEENGKTHIKVTKLRDAEKGRVYPFRLESVHLGIDDDGDAYGSCVVDWAGEIVAEKPDPGAAVREAIAEVLANVEGHRMTLRAAAEATGDCELIGAKNLTRAFKKVMGGASEANSTRGKLTLTVTGQGAASKIALAPGVFAASPPDAVEFVAADDDADD